jgi:hypothetical protein
MIEEEEEEAGLCSIPVEFGSVANNGILRGNALVQAGDGAITTLLHGEPRSYSGTEQIIPFDNSLQHCELSPDGSFLLAVFESSDLKVFDTEANRVKLRRRAESLTYTPFWAPCGGCLLVIASSPDGVELVELVDVSREETVDQLEVSGGVIACQTGPPTSVWQKFSILLAAPGDGVELRIYTPFAPLNFVVSVAEHRQIIEAGALYSQCFEKTKGGYAFQGLFGIPVRTCAHIDHPIPASEEIIDIAWNSESEFCVATGTSVFVCGFSEFPRFLDPDRKIGVERAQQIDLLSAPYFLRLRGDVFVVDDEKRIGQIRKGQFIESAVREQPIRGVLTAPMRTLISDGTLLPVDRYSSQLRAELSTMTQELQQFTRSLEQKRTGLDDRQRALDCRGRRLLDPATGESIYDRLRKIAEWQERERAAIWLEVEKMNTDMKKKSAQVPPARMSKIRQNGELIEKLKERVRKLNEGK